MSGEYEHVILRRFFDLIWIWNQSLRLRLVSSRLLSSIYSLPFHLLPTALPFYPPDSPLMIIPLLARNTTTDDNSATTASSPTTDNTNTHAHTSLAHRNLVGILVIATLLALALLLSLCFAKWSKPIRRLLRGELSSTHARFGIGDGLSTLSKVPRPSPPPTRPHRANAAADAEKAAAIIPDSSTTQSSLDRDMIEIDKAKEKANVQVALPAKVRKMRTVLSVLERLFFLKNT